MTSVVGWTQCLVPHEHGVDYHPWHSPESVGCMLRHSELQRDQRRRAECGRQVAVCRVSDSALAEVHHLVRLLEP